MPVVVGRAATKAMAAAALATAVALAGCSTGGSDDVAVVPCDRYRFDPRAWGAPSTQQEIPSPRQQQAERLHACRTLIGMTRDEVIGRLGKRGLIKHPRSVEYELGFQSDIYVDTDILWIRFDPNGRVTRVQRDNAPGDPH